MNQLFGLQHRRRTDPVILGANIINAEPGNLIIHDAKHTNCVYRLWDKIPWTGEE